ncbi:MAG: 8-amino-7-oxononanoate synthase [Candidatus Omnitrophica bacterium]|jgi:8-amino-7-oxononanoate synthase|nr:8-amino-7-oxononanoate synthase [Candidatus Omnitrophota bacterium]
MEKIEDFLDKIKSQNLYRELQPANRKKDGCIYFKDKEYLDFSSNDYLGLSDHPYLKNAAQRAILRFGAGTAASRLLSGDLEIHHHLEEKIAQFKGKEAALIFNSGYQANIGIISALCQKGDVIFSDKLNHASIIDGMLLSQAKFFRFSHNDVNHLAYLLKKERFKFKNSLIITETVFSMDGDKPSLAELVNLKDKYNCSLLVDEAHATGIFGKNGSGVAEQEGLTEKIDLIMGTFSKALGSFGAYLACSAKIKDYLINTCRSFIYSTALPPAVIAANLASLKVVRKEPLRRKTLLENAEYLRKNLKSKNFKVKGESQIIPLILGDSKKALQISKALFKRGYWVKAIRPPTVPKNEARLRFSLTCHHNKKILDKLIQDLYEVINS